MFGNILGAAIRIINAPVDAAEKLVAFTNNERDLPSDEKIASAPLRALAEALEEIDDD